MQSNAFFAAGLLDNPWVVVAIFVLSFLTNWLAKRREEKRAEQLPRADEPSPSSGRPPDKFDLEETLRQLMGQESPAHVPAPPLIPRAAQELPPVANGQEEFYETARQALPRLRPPPITVIPDRILATVASDEEMQAARRFEKLNEQGRHPATVIDHGRRTRSRPDRWNVTRWRDPRTVRRAFVASTVFSPPKSLEP